MDWRLRRACELYLKSFNRQWNRLRTDRSELKRQRQHQPEAGLISVIVPVWNTRPDWLAELAASLREQTLEKWQCVLYDGGSTDAGTLHVLKGLPDCDKRFRVIHAKENQRIVGNTNAAAALANGKWIAFCDHDDVLQPDALWRMASALADDQADVAYSDEDRITADGRTHYAPHFKPDFCPANLLACNYVCHLVMMRKSLFDRLGGLRAGMEGSQDHDLMLRCMMQGSRMVHVPHILYHWRNNGGSMSHVQREKCLLSGRLAVTEAAKNGCPEADVVPNGDRLHVVYPWPDAARVRVLLHGDEADERRLTPLLVCDDPARIVVQRVSGDILASAMTQARQPLLLLWDASLTPEPGMVRELASLAIRPENGSVVPQVLDAKGRILFSGYGCHGRKAFIRNRGLKPEQCDPVQLETSVHHVGQGSLLCMMFRRQLLTAANAVSGMAYLPCLVSPFAQARGTLWSEKEPQPFDDGTLIGLPSQRR